VSTQPDIQ